MLAAILLILAGVLLSTNAQAQLAVGARAGCGLTTFVQRDSRDNFNLGFQMGVIGEYAISETFAIQSGLLFATQGAWWKIGRRDDDIVYFKESTNLNYFQLPINFQQRSEGKIKFLFQAGPYFGYALSGKVKSEVFLVDGRSIETNSKIDFGRGKNEIKAFDFGVGLGIGTLFNNFQIGMGYNRGLVNLANDRRTMKSSSFTLTVTYLFYKTKFTKTK